MVYAKTKDKEEWKKHVTSMCCVLIASLIMSVNLLYFIITLLNKKYQNYVSLFDGEKCQFYYLKSDCYNGVIG